MSGISIFEEAYTFSPHGVSGVVVIAESHVAIHTWPEHAYAAVDIFSCGTKLDHTIIRDHLRSGLAATNIEARELTRG
ncbi:MAG: adenosylmethionine decarboxylase, partial [Chthoniobacteraceae bacterium]